MNRDVAVRSPTATAVATARSVRPTLLTPKKRMKKTRDVQPQWTLNEMDLACFDQIKSIS